MPLATQPDYKLGYQCVCYCYSCSLLQPQNCFHRTYARLLSLTTQSQDMNRHATAKTWRTVRYLMQNLLTGTRALFSTPENIIEELWSYLEWEE